MRPRRVGHVERLHFYFLLAKPPSLSSVSAQKAMPWSWATCPPFWNIIRIKTYLHFKWIFRVALNKVEYKRFYWHCAFYIPKIMPCHVCMLNRVWLFVTLWTVAHQAPLSMEFSRQEYWSGLPFPPWRDLSDPGIQPTSPTSLELAVRFFTTEPPRSP